MASPARPLADRPSRRLTVQRADGPARTATAGDPALRIEPPAPKRRRDQADAPPLRIVPPAARRRRAALVAALVAVSLLAVMLGPIALQAKLAADQLRLDRLERQRRAAVEQQEKLQLQLTLLESPEHVVDEARRLGMVQPDRITYLTPSAGAAAAVAEATGAVPGPSSSTRTGSGG